MRYLIVISFTLLLAQERRIAEPDAAANEQMVLVPNVFGYRYERAIDTLMKLGLSMGESVGVASDYETGHVIRQEPRAGSVVPIETAVSLSVSSGPGIIEPEKVEVPPLLGRGVEMAETMLVEARLHVGRKTFVEHNAEPGTIVDQTPSAGTRVPVKTEVHLAIATTDPYRYVIVPLVVGQKLKQAQDAIERAQLRVGKINKEFAEAAPGTVIEQTPRGETRVRVHTPVNLVVEGRKTNPLPWIIGGSLIVLGLGGYLVVRHMVKSKKAVEPTRHQVRLEPKRDFGEHYVDSKDTLQFDFEICFLPFPDTGIQIIDIEGSLIVDERGSDE